MPYQLYHATEADTPEQITQNFADGAKPQGAGLGGQTSGFYVFTGRQAAERHCEDMLSKPARAVLRFEADTTKDFDLDYECNMTAVMKLLYEHRHLLQEMIESKTRLSFRDQQNSRYCPVLNGTAEQFFFEVRSINTGVAQTISFKFGRADENAPAPAQLTSIRSLSFNPQVGSTDSFFSGVAQRMCDYLKEKSPEFADAHKKLLGDILARPGCGVKYVGQSPLQPKSIEIYAPATQENQLKPATAAP